jgi:ATP-dependent 26S proteasome regulatory subunit
MRKWFSAIGNFRAYIHGSGVGAEMEESMMKPLLQGRLLDNIKMFIDIQKLQDAERVLRVSDRSLVSEMELEKGSAMMRFTTSAYGVEMIKSAIDAEVNAMDLESERQAIAFHCKIGPDDVKLLKIRDGGDMMTLRHYVVVDHKNKYVVLALRGMLSIYGNC